MKKRINTWILCLAVGSFSLGSASPLGSRFFFDSNATQIGVFNGDWLVPLVGERTQFLYLNGSGGYQTNGLWHGGIGVGFRQVKHSLWGAYLFADINRHKYHNNFWLLNPGLEWMSAQWDAHINGYFPVGNSKHTQRMWGDELGIADAVSFENHTQYDYLFEQTTEVARGLDAALGYRFQGQYHPRIYLGMYGFQFKHAKNIQGVQGGGELPINSHFTLLLRDSYDNRFHNRVSLGFRLTWGALPQSSELSVQDRVLDPVYRHFGPLELGQTLPTAKTIRNTHQRGVERENIYFFTGDGGTAYDPNKGAGQCTAEHPCSAASFTQASVDNISTFVTAPNFYLNPGHYTVDSFYLRNQQSIFGRTEDYRLDAYWHGNLPILKGQLTLQGENYLHSIQLENTGAFTTGMVIDNAQNIDMDHIKLGEQSNAVSLNFTQAINIDHADNISIKNSAIRAVNKAEDKDDLNVLALHIKDSHHIHIQNNKILAKAELIENIDNDASVLAQGIIVENSKLDLVGNTIDVFADGIGKGNFSLINTSAMGLIIDSDAGTTSRVDMSKNHISIHSRAEGNGFVSSDNNFGILVQAEGAGSQAIVNSTADRIDSNVTTLANGFVSRIGGNFGVIATSDDHAQVTINLNGGSIDLRSSASNMGPGDGLANNTVNIAARATNRSLVNIFANQVKLLQYIETKAVNGNNSQQGNQRLDAITDAISGAKIIYLYSEDH